MGCSGCDFENAAGKKFCIRCGAALIAHCPTCGSKNPPQASFCGDCGAALTGTPAPNAPGAFAAEPTALGVRGTAEQMDGSVATDGERKTVTAEDDERRRQEKITGKILTLDRALEDTLPYIFMLLGAEEPAEAIQQMNPQLRRRGTLDAIKRVLLRVPGTAHRSYPATGARALRLRAGAPRRRVATAAQCTRYRWIQHLLRSSRGETRCIECIGVRQ
jgi:Double zinc ribbon